MVARSPFDRLRFDGSMDSVEVGGLSVLDIHDLVLSDSVHIMPVLNRIRKSLAKNKRSLYARQVT